MNLIRKLLLPFVPIYFIITRFRNKLYDLDLKKSTSYDVPVIVVGNLSVGGTGKSPMVEYLIRLLKEEFKVATLSRGYKRETKGFHRVSQGDTAKQVGDEPLQFKTKFNDVEVSVDEDRRNGIKNLMSNANQPEVIILDDAFQHRTVKAGLYVLLTAYGDLYCDDIVLPTGNLREPRNGVKRAGIVVVTKCPPNISEGERKAIAKRLRLESHQHLFFSFIDYENVIRSNDQTHSIDNLKKKSFSLVTGIANPKPLLAYYESLDLEFEHISFPDHHNFTDKELNSLRGKKMIVTTEKDYMRLEKDFTDNSLWYQSIAAEFIDQKDQFNQLILNFVKKMRS